MSLNNNIQNLQNIISSLEGKAAGGGSSVQDNAQYAQIIRFTDAVFPEGYEMQLKLLNSLSMPVFRGTTGIRKVTIDVPTEKTYDASNMAYMANTIEEFVFPNGIKFPVANYMCTNAASLRSIQGTMDMTGNTSNNMWTGCTLLEHISFVPNTIGAKVDFAKSPLLSDASIQSIIDGLANLSGQTTQTLTLHADVGAKLTEAQKESARLKNWTLAY